MECGHTHGWLGFSYLTLCCGFGAVPLSTALRLTQQRVQHCLGASAGLWLTAHAGFITGVGLISQFQPS
jgi:hypothetical protein